MEEERKKDLNEVTKNIRYKLKQLGEKYGYNVEDEVIIGKELGEKEIIGIIDVVWFQKLPFITKKIPIFAFEIETSWRTSNALKGDISKISILNPAIGVILFPSKRLFNKPEEFDRHINAVKRYAKFMGVNNMLVWSEEDIDKFLS
tara:strand:- start:58 stop:495 length:438 start_codon:yes stop_codon:yes gene_type:complete